MTQSLSRPRVSDVSPFSEAQSKTLKYHPGFPGRFAGQEAATGYCRSFFAWYDNEHRHAGIAMLTLADVHFGRAPAVLSARQNVLDVAYENTPERFPRGRPRAAVLPEVVYIDPPQLAGLQTGGAH